MGRRAPFNNRLGVRRDEIMGLTTARFFSLLFAALALAPALAHLLELPNKIGLSRDDYMTVQQIYRGRALLGFVVAGALLSTLILTIMVRKRPRECGLPENWIALRTQWEYSH